MFTRINKYIFSLFIYFWKSLLKIWSTVLFRVNVDNTFIKQIHQVDKFEDCFALFFWYPRWICIKKWVKTWNKPSFFSFLLFHPYIGKIWLLCLGYWEKKKTYLALCFLLSYLWWQLFFFFLLSQAQKMRLFLSTHFCFFLVQGKHVDTLFWRPIGKYQEGFNYVFCYLLLGNYLSLLLQLSIMKDKK